MAENGKILLTNDFPVDMKVSVNEKRILENLRKYGQIYTHSRLCSFINVHDGRLQNGTVDLAQSEIKL
jgi:hypothetical protein